MARVGILGGTFDPPHNAHVAMAETALERVPLDKVLLMPAPHPPQKRPDMLTPYAARLDMLSLAITGHRGLELSRLEEFRPGPSYTVDLLETFTDQSDDEPFLILGADSVCDLPKWRDPERILELATLVVFPRTGYSSAVAVGRRGTRPSRVSVVLFESPVIDISSTRIRKKVREGSSVEMLIAGPVHKFILDNGLYT
jgi:nicotinate-nucleotide adenylyltransferase